MGIFNSFGAMSGQFAAKQERGEVAKALAAEVQIPGRLDSILLSIKGGPLAEHLQRWMAGNTAPIAAGELTQVLGGSGLMESLSQRTNMPPGVVRSSVAILLPLAVHHLAAGGYLTGEGHVSSQSAPDPDALLQALR